jgi:hypothetical protein
MQGNLSKMAVELHNPVSYILRLENELTMNEALGHRVSISFDGQINCVNCGRKIKKAFGQGFCYPCFMNAPQNAACIIRPELCEAHLGKGRDPEWEARHHYQEHIVYLALTSTVKVGVTRSTQVPTRWIDQGAWKAIPVARVPYRQLAGKIEVALKESFTDKTSWQKMLKDVRDNEAELSRERDRLATLLPEDLKEYVIPDEPVTEIHYPVVQPPEKVKSLNLMKQPEYSGKLSGIRGQYLIFEDNTVFNVRNHSGFRVFMDID